MYANNVSAYKWVKELDVCRIPGFDSVTLKFMTVPSHAVLFCASTDMQFCLFDQTVQKMSWATHPLTVNVELGKLINW